MDIIFTQNYLIKKVMRSQKNTLLRTTDLNRLLSAPLRQLKEVALFIFGISRLKNDDFYFW